MAVQAPAIVNQPLPAHWGRGRPNGLRPVLLVMHIQDGMGNPWSYFNGLGTDGAGAADCTIWNPRDTGSQLRRYLRDEDTAWTNGSWSEPINHRNPVIQDLLQRGISTNDVSLTIEHEGNPQMSLTEAQLERTVAICAWWCQQWNIPADRNHIVGHYEIGPHKYCPGQFFPFDRLVARVQLLLGSQPQQPENFQLIPLNYQVIIPQFTATVRGGPGRSYPIITSLPADPNRLFQVDGEAHGELIGTDDVWTHIPELNGYITRSALQIVHMPPVPTPTVIEPGSGSENQERFRAAFLRNGGEARLGKPNGKVFAFNQSWFQDFNGGSLGNGTIYLDDRNDKADAQPLPILQPAFAVFGTFYTAWNDSYGGNGGVLGSPLSDEFINLQGNRQQSFEGGYIVLQGSSNNLDAAYPWPDAFNSWKAEYYNNPGLAGKPAYTRDEPGNQDHGFDNNWGSGSPENGALGIFADNFSARYSRSFDFGNGGNFKLSVNADDGFRLFVDGFALVGANPDQYWVAGAPIERSFTAFLTPGIHTILVEFMEAGGNAQISLDIESM
jgi:hypothetical protein